MCFPRGSSAQEERYSLKIRVFQIPPIQTVIAAGDDGKGGITGHSMGGDISQSFPPHVVLLKTDLDLNAPDASIKQTLLDNGYFKEARSFLPNGIEWWSTGDYSISCSANEIGKASIPRTYHEPKGTSMGSRNVEYWLTIQPNSVDDVSFGLKLKFVTGESNQRMLLDQNISVSLGKTLIVGFPTETEMPPGTSRTRGIIYFLAIYVQRAGDLSNSVTWRKSTSRIDCE